MKQLAIVIILALSIFNNSYAGSEDWTGIITFKDANGNPGEVKHTSKMVSYSFFNAGGCINLSKGAVINGSIIPDDIHICVNQNVDVFVAEAKKFGTITNKSISLGSTYIT